MVEKDDEDTTVGVEDEYVNLFELELTTVGLEVLPTQVKELDSVSNKLIYPSLSSEVVS